MIEATTVEIPDGDAGTLATIEQMRALVNNRCSHPAIRTLAVSLAGRSERTDEQIARIRAWLRSRVQFIHDPYNNELLHDPVQLVEWIDQHGYTRVDCDDVAVLGASLGMAIGIPARFVVVGFYSPNAPYGHVWAELFDGQTWRELDTTRANQRIEDSRISRRVYIDVVTGDQGDSMAGSLTRTRRIGAFPNRRLGYAAAVTTGISLFQTIAPLLKSSKEPDRLKQIEQAERLAMAGDQEALEFLRCRSVQNQVCNITGYAEPIGGFATDTARAKAAEAYNRVVAAQRSGTAPTGTGGGVSVTTPFGNAGASANMGGMLLLGGLAFLLLKRR